MRVSLVAAPHGRAALVAVFRTRFPTSGPLRKSEMLNESSFLLKCNHAC